MARPGRASSWSRASAKSPGPTPAADKIERETRFYITSLALLASLIGPLIRDHWAVENSLHWVLDMVFRDDECRLRTDHAPANFTTLKHIALNPHPKGARQRIHCAEAQSRSRDDDFLASVIAP